jgi:hypothetical protein
MPAPIQIYSGSATIGSTEYSLPASSTTLASVAVAGVYTLLLDLSALTSTEQYELRLYEKVRSGGTQRLMDSATFTGTQAKPLFMYTPPLPLMHGWDMTLRKTAGIDRAIEWSIRSSSAPAAAEVATAVRAELATELGRVDVAIGSREAETAAATRASGRMTEHDTVMAALVQRPTLAAIEGSSALARQATLQALPAAVGAELADDFANVGAAIDDLGTGIAAELLASDPRTAPANSVGAGLARLLVVPGPSPLVPVPAAPTDNSLCRVYGYITTADRRPAAGVEVTFELVRPQGAAVASALLISGDRFTARTNGAGALASAHDKTWLEMTRTDRMQPAGATYKVTCAALGVSDKVVTLTADVVDLRALLVG